MISALPELCLDPEDIARVAEFFDCDRNAAIEFAARVWLPDARITALRIAAALHAADWKSLRFLCDHLREGARCVGARRILCYAGEIETAATSKRFGAAVRCARDLRFALDSMGAVLASDIALAGAAIQAL